MSYRIFLKVVMAVAVLAKVLFENILIAAVSFAQKKIC
jgi:hypothetical protein